MQSGDWIEWHLPGVFLRRAQVTRVTPVSVELLCLGENVPRVIPVIEYVAGELTVIPRPLSVTGIERARAAGVMTPPRAAAILGVELKHLRAMLRDGRLRGRREGGRWVEVELPEEDSGYVDVSPS